MKLILKYIPLALISSLDCTFGNRIVNFMSPVECPVGISN